MKSEREIRKRRDDLVACAKKPCACRGEHSQTCFIGGKMMLAVARTLSWVLDETVDHDSMVETLAKAARE